MKIPKINTVHYGGIWIGSSIVIGLILPGVIWILFHVFFVWLCILGAIDLLSFVLLFSIEMKQDFGEVPYYEKELSKTIPFDETKQVAVIRSSICTGEKMAGFRNKTDRSFTEVMVIRSDDDLERFKKIYHIQEIKTEY